MSEPTEVEKLQREIDSLRDQLADANARVQTLRWQNQALESVHLSPEQKARSHQNAEVYYWIAKCQRQRRAINHIQRKGWYPPEYVIREEETPWELDQTA